ncbi:MAG: GAF and ANTAR domain-containing protein [Actinomycetota bacterium]|nr:GAF and ANTAR domain-containing protein [Actinomycetota bacterium]
MVVSDTSGEAMPRALNESMSALAGVLLNEQTVEAILHMLVTQARAAMDHIDGASVSLLRTGKFETTTATSEEVRDADAVQYDSGVGPCITAAGGHTVSIGLDDTRDRWPEFASAALAKGFIGVLSTPLAVRERCMGSLNLYSKSRNVFDENDIQVAQRFANQASVVLNNATAFSTAEMVNDQLREALATRDLIGQAKGMIMVTEGCDANQAFDILRRASQHSNRKLRDVAAEIVQKLGSSSRSTA